MGVFAERVKKELAPLGSLTRANTLRGFFKTGKGEYGEGDIFLGISVPVQRKVAEKYSDIPLRDIQVLLQSVIHEHRLVALLIMVSRYEHSGARGKGGIFKFYLKNCKHINNWDLVDVSAPRIVGAHLLRKKKTVVYKFAGSRHLWKKRIAIISTFAFIKHDCFEDTFRIAEILMNDKHDLIHKAVGWMLREVGKRDPQKEEIFLKKYHKKMSRTTLRYAIERFPEKKRKLYLDGRV